MGMFLAGFASCAVAMIVMVMAMAKVEMARLQPARREWYRRLYTKIQAAEVLEKPSVK